MAGLTMGTFAITVNMLYLVMIGKINEKVPKNKRISYFRWGSGVKKQFRELYPTSRLLLAVNIFQALFLPTFAVGAWVILHS